MSLVRCVYIKHDYGFPSDSRTNVLMGVSRRDTRCAKYSEHDTTAEKNDDSDEDEPRGTGRSWRDDLPHDRQIGNFLLGQTESPRFPEQTPQASRRFLARHCLDRSLTDHRLKTDSLFFVRSFFWSLSDCMSDYLSLDSLRCCNSLFRQKFVR